MIHITKGNVVLIVTMILAVTTILESSCLKIGIVPSINASLRYSPIFFFLQLNDLVAFSFPVNLTARPFMFISDS